MTERLEHLLASQVTARPHAIALTDSTGAKLTWADLDALSLAGCALLRDQGVRRGDRALLIIENCAEAVALLFSCWCSGVTAVPVNARQSASEISRVLAHADPALVLFSTAVSENARAHAGHLGAVPAPSPFGGMHLARMHPGAPDDYPDLAVLLYTTGTTGDPKAVMLTHENLLFGGGASARLRRMVPDDLIYGVLPVTHVFGLTSVIVAAVTAGAAVRLEPRFEVDRLYRALGEGITLLSAVPQMHGLLMHYTARQGYTRLGSDTLRYASSGAAPLDPDWKRQAEAFYGMALQNGYGMTETSAGVSITDNPAGSADTSTGPPLPGVQVRIDETVPGGGDGLGEVLVRGPNVTPGYYRLPEETARVIDSAGWLHTGDLGHLDDQGRLHILSRSKELIIHGGFNVYPPEVEAAINEHPEVMQSAVIGRAAAGDEEVLAFVQTGSGSTLTEAELLEFLRQRLSGYKRPAQIVFARQLPAAPTGKLLKHLLLKELGDRLR
ncbi:class I adenylate-forming enzyme family protein [uncultured Roseobacter sp.]|uniref:class I adenylate-forming enzyme family protein n=1 Tax=uncultured Roseobacter sp. TaxID=114847 RepID=UPI00261ED6D9|nr:class I adenylate-forming enzyme family protein [uncultured Roseobacter sp.]